MKNFPCWNTRWEQKKSIFCIKRERLTKLGNAASGLLTQESGWRCFREKTKTIGTVSLKWTECPRTRILFHCIMVLHVRSYMKMCKILYFSSLKTLPSMHKTFRCSIIDSFPYMFNAHKVIYVPGSNIISLRNCCWFLKIPIDCCCLGGGWYWDIKSYIISL